MKNLFRTAAVLTASMILTFVPVNARETGHEMPAASNELVQVLNIGQTSDGSMGTLVIGDYSAKLYNSSTQATVDAENSAAYMPWGNTGKVFIADHASQGFRVIRTLGAGATGSITDDAGTTILTMVSSYQGTNTGKGIDLADGRYSECVNDGNYILYTCNDSTGVSVTVTYWTAQQQTAAVIAAIETPVVAAGTVAMFRLYNCNSGEHFYTSNSSERDHLINVGWKYEGVGWIAPESGDPVYRVYNPNAGLHHYTMNAAEKDYLVSIGWLYEGIGWYSDVNKAVAIYRQYNPNAGMHNYTSSEAENTMLVSAGWKAEGIGWYGVK